MKAQVLYHLLSILGSASAHTTFVQLTSGGTTYPVGYAIADPSYDGPINDVTHNAMACNGDGNPTTSSPNVITVQAGSTVQATWRHTLTSTVENDSVYVVDPSHLGPVQAYMKKVSNATTDGPGSGWFKISEAGLNVATNTWATTTLIANAGIQQIPIPACIASGQYLLRAELLALHAAGSLLGAQFYMECAQINVVGGTGASSPPTVSIPGAYGQSDPGILINIYQTLTTYQIPGPTVFACGGAQATSTKAGSTTTKATTLTTSTKAATTSSTKAATTSSTSTGSAALYGQCGGIGWTGPTSCASGTCTYSSAYYSQCL